ncbi:MAG: GTP-dependent dephospho-CoA kinase family protein [Methanomicrobiales archaeon]|nr:GTP-dependent dephospho-CoA kinase family protein [Methanomicrobiales archaeon]
MLRLPAHHREGLHRPFGTLYRNLSELLPLLSGKQVYAVGDVVTHRLLRIGVVPEVAVIDGKTMRTPCSWTPEYHARKIHAMNPPGTITDELIAAIRVALSHPPSLIVVEGEEDLAVLPLVLAAPEGGMLLYGQPNEGVVLREIDAQAKKDATNLLSLFTSE